MRWATRCCRVTAGMLAGAGLLAGCGEEHPTQASGSSVNSPSSAGSTATSPRTAPGLTSSSPPGQPDLIAGVRLVEAEGGASYEVTPREALRDHLSAAALDAAWGEVTAAYPEADTDGLHDQFVCHAYFANAKPTWDLEPWRADLTYPETVATACNPPRA